MPTGNDDVENTTNTNISGYRGRGERDCAGRLLHSTRKWRLGIGDAMDGISAAKRSLTFYTDGDYIATQGGTNGVQKSATLSATTPLENYVAHLRSISL